MNIEEATKLSLQGKLNENVNEVNIKKIARDLWRFDGGEYYMDEFINEGPFENADKYANYIFYMEIRNGGFDPVQDEYDLTNEQALHVYKLIYEMILDNIDDYTQENEFEESKSFKRSFY